MSKQKNKSLANELTRFLIELSDNKNRDTLRKRAYELIERVSPVDFSRAEHNLMRTGLSPEEIKKLSTVFIMMGLAERDKTDLRLRLPDYHVLRKVMAEHEMLRCFLADLEDVTDRICETSHLATTSGELMQLSHITEHLNSLDEHIGREDDVLFPALKERGWKSLFCRIESEHEYIRMAVDDLVKLIVVFDKMPFATFKTRLKSTVHYLCPLLREHLLHEDRVLFPLAVSITNDDGIWERLRQICNEIGYCGIHL